MPIMRKNDIQRVAFVVHSASSHKELKDARKKIDIMPLPPNVTAFHQPMDLGIFAAWKRQ